jgi:hypothetical protein
MGDVTHTADFKAVAVTAQQDLFEIRSSTAAVTVVHGFIISQSSEVADAQEEQLTLTTNRAFGSSPTSGSGGTTATATVRVRGQPAFGGTIEVNNTGKIAAGTGTLTTDLEVQNINVRVPYIFWYTPESRPVILPGEYWTLELETTPGDSITMSGTVFLEQIGT